MLTIRSIFLYLDRTYVLSTSGVRSLFEMGLQLFGGHLGRHPEARAAIPLHPHYFLIIPAFFWPFHSCSSSAATWRATPRRALQAPSTVTISSSFQHFLGHSIPAALRRPPRPPPRGKRCNPLHHYLFLTTSPSF
jgi:hypothetical protein